MNYFTSDSFSFSSNNNNNNNSSSFSNSNNNSNNKKALLSLQQINNLSRKRYSQDLTSTLTNISNNSNNNNNPRPVSITSEYLADKLNQIRTQQQQQQHNQSQPQQYIPPLRVKKSRSSLYSSSSSSLYRQPLLPNSFLSNPSPRVRLRNLALRAQPYRSFFTRLSTVFEEEDHPSNNNNNNTNITNDLNNKSKLITNFNNKNNENNSKLANTFNNNNNTNTFINNNRFSNHRIVSHKLNGSIGKKFKPTAYYSSFENEKNEIDYESFLYTDPSLNTNSNTNKSTNSNDQQIEFNSINKRSSFTPLNLKPEFRIDATDKNILNEFNLLLLDELKRIKARNQQQQQQQNNETENTKIKQPTDDIINSTTPSKQSKNIQTNQTQLPKKQSVYTSTDNDDVIYSTNTTSPNPNESHNVYKIMNSNPPIPPNLAVNKKQQQNSQIKLNSPNQLITNKIKPGDPNTSSLMFNLNDAPKVRVISRGSNGDGQMPPRPNKVSSPPTTTNSDRTSPQQNNKPIYPDVVYTSSKPSVSPKTIASLPVRTASTSIKSPTTVKYSNVPQPQLQPKDIFYNYSDPYSNQIRSNKDMNNNSLVQSQSSSSLAAANSALSNYYNKLYSTDLRPDNYNYEDYLYKPSNYYDDNNNNTKSSTYNKLTDSFSSMMSLKNLNPSPSTSQMSNSPLPIIYTSSNNNSLVGQTTLSRQEPYHVTSIPVVYVNSSNRNDKVILNPAASQPLPLFQPKPNRIINIEDIKREIEKEAEEITENKLNQQQQKNQKQQELIEQIKQEVAASVTHSNQQQTVSPIQEEEEPYEIEKEEENRINDEDDTTTTTEENFSDKTTTEETTTTTTTTSSEEVEINSEETTNTSSEEITNNNDTTVDDLTSEDNVNQNLLLNEINISTQIKSPTNMLKLISPTLDKSQSASVSPLPSQSTTSTLDNSNNNINKDIDLIKEDQESELVNMIKDIKSTLESCCFRDEQPQQKQNQQSSSQSPIQSTTPQPNLKIDQEKSLIVTSTTPTKLVKSNIRNLPMFHNKLINSNLDDDDDDDNINIGSSNGNIIKNINSNGILNTSQDDYEENEFFEILY